MFIALKRVRSRKCTLQTLITNLSKYPYNVLSTITSCKFNNYVTLFLVSLYIPKFKCYLIRENIARYCDISSVVILLFLRYIPVYHQPSN